MGLKSLVVVAIFSQTDSLNVSRVLGPWLEVFEFFDAE